MRFNPMPPGTVTTALIAIALLLTWIVWGSFKYPEALWAPGDLSRFHADISRCSACHQPFQGAKPEKCLTCHTQRQFSLRTAPKVSEFHQKAQTERKPCSGCHTEHRGALAQITIGAMENPHGEFVFRVTGARSCSSCHNFSDNYESTPTLLDNYIVKHLLEEGEGSHRLGKMTQCLKCHKGGRLYIEDEKED